MSSQLDYGLIGNCQISALVEKTGKVAWCCMPRFDAPSVFASLLDSERGGHWSIEPAPSEGVKLGESSALSAQHQRARHGLHELRRRAVRDRRLHAALSPRQRHGLQARADRPHPASPARHSPRGSARASPASITAATSLAWSTSAPRFFIRRAKPACISRPTRRSPTFSKRRRLSSRSPSISCCLTARLSRARSSSRSRSSSTARSLTGEPGPSTATSPLSFRTRCCARRSRSSCTSTRTRAPSSRRRRPRCPKGRSTGRCWDYRFCWLRDAYFVVTALNRLGQFDEMEAFIHYLQNIGANEPSKQLQPVYGIGGEKELIERELPWLSGFKGYGPVRVGNAAWKMEQHDVYGEMVLAITPTFFDRRLDRTDQEQALRNVAGARRAGSQSALKSPTPGSGSSAGRCATRCSRSS